MWGSEDHVRTHLSILFIALILPPGPYLEMGFGQSRSSKEPAKAVLITGCLVKGDEPGEVWLAQKNGRIYGLEGGKIDLNAHLGQKVMVTGYVLPEGREGKDKSVEETKKENKTSKNETADFRVRMLKTISKNCTQ
jgi:hypothetical protein